jgi:sigma-B regulation protein RsbU (phosphoserine phosphatase)
MLIKDRCIGVFDLESPELNAFTKEHKELLTLLASQAAVAIENAQAVRGSPAQRGADREGAPFRAEGSGGAAPTSRRSISGSRRRAPFRAGPGARGDLHDFLSPESNSLVVAVGDVSGKGAPAALYGAYAAELVRSRTMRRRYTPDRFSVSGVLQSMNTILHERQLEEYYCTLCYAFFDFRRRELTLSNSGLPYPIHCSGERMRTHRAAGRSARIIPRRQLRRE